MKNIYVFVCTIIFLFISCSPDSETDEVPANELVLSIESPGNSFEVDQPVSFVVKSNQNLSEVAISNNNWQSSHGQLDGDGTGLGFAKTVFMSFDQIGMHTINVKIESLEGKKKETSFQVDIIKGTAIKINRITINSFKNMGQSWDPEYAADDVNRLADLVFGLRKNYIITSFDEREYASKTWYISEVLMNEGNLTWDLSAANLHIDPNLILWFGLGDDDGGGIAQDLLLGPPFDLDVMLKDYIIEKPATITLQKQDIDLEVVFEIEW